MNSSKKRQFFNALAAPLAALGLILSFTSRASAADIPDKDFWQTPAIAGFGSMHPLPKASFQPEKTELYKVVFSASKEIANPSEVNDDLDTVARTVNLYASAGIPLDHLKFVVVLSRGATPIALDAKHYKDKFNVDNPNLELIEKLRTARVEIVVCGQSVLRNNFHFDWINLKIHPALSALTTLTLLQNRGYALMEL